nr:hypothetical protein [Tanacetum cinerariifolium]
MPKHTIPMLSKKPRRATADLHQDILGTRNMGLGYLAKRTQPVIYDDNTLLDPTHTPVSVWDSDDVLVNQVVSMHKMKDKPGHVRPESGFYAKLNAIKFVPQIELSREQAYWLNSQDHTPFKPVTPFVRKGSLDKNALETEITQLKDNITSLKIQNDGYKVTNANLNKCYQELSKANTHLHTTSLEKIATQKAEIATLKAEAKPTVPVNMFLKAKPATEGRKPIPKRNTQNHNPLPAKSVKARRAADYYRNLYVDIS